MKQNIYLRILSYLMFIFIIILIPTYLHYYGLQNFLWLSDQGLFLTCFALWFNLPICMSMAAVGVMVLELVWCVDFFGELIFNINLITLSDYMFDPKYPWELRAISLFHIATPIIWLIYLKQFGYKPKALSYFIPLYWLVLLLTYLFTPLSDNINWVFVPEILHLKFLNNYVWLAILAIGFPVFIFWPTHLLYKKIFKTN